MFCYACGSEMKIQKLTNPNYYVDYFNEDFDHCWIPNDLTNSQICPGLIRSGSARNITEIRGSCVDREFK